MFSDYFLKNPFSGGSSYISMFAWE